MAHSKQIFEELLSLSELVATLPAAPTFQIPSGYFDDLSEAIMSRIPKTGQNESNNSFDEIRHFTPYQIPADYFSQLPTAVLSKIKLEHASPQEELEILAPLLLRFRNTNRFTLPKAYFDEFPATIVERLKFEQGVSSVIGDEILPPLLREIKLTSPYKIQEGYFEKFAASVVERIKSEEAISGNEEVSILSPLFSPAKKALPFKLPEGYFDELAASIVERIQLNPAVSGKEELEILSPLLGQIEKIVPFKLPEGYFDEFPLDITAGVKAVDYVNQELESHTPIMNDLKIQNVYRVPDGYFDRLGDELLTAAKYNRKTSVLSITFHKRIARYAVAALAAGIMGIAAWTFYDKQPVLKTGNEVADIKKISNEEIIKYLESTSGTFVENDVTTSAMTKDDDPKDLFADVPDEELKQYLEQHPVSKYLIN